MREKPNNPNPSGLCMCGCGQPTKIATITDRTRGDRVSGYPTCYIFGHQRRGKRHSEATKQRLREAQTGKKHTPESLTKMSEKQRGRPHAKGAEDPKFKGYHYQRGRLMVYVGVGHPMANRTGRVFAYRLVAARKIGRWLSVDEHVHHIDLNPQNDDPDNLLVCSRSQHSRIHSLIRRRGLDPVEAARQIMGAGFREVVLA